MTIRYPAGLPAPRTAREVPTERRHISTIDGYANFRTFQRDYHGTYEVTFVMTPAQALQFLEWWKGVLKGGGGWFAANWPLQQGVKDNVFRAIESPAIRWTGGCYDGQGVRYYSGTFEVRGRGMLPGEPEGLVLTSVPYPVIDNNPVAHSLNVRDVDWMPGPRMVDPVTHSINIEVAVRTEVKYSTYENWPSESVSHAVDIGVTVRTEVKYSTYGDWPPESVSHGLDVIGVQAERILIRYSNWETESVSHAIDIDISVEVP